ncbi:Lpcat2b, partial [Symbiodinium pilosum]
WGEQWQKLHAEVSHFQRPRALVVASRKTPQRSLPLPGGSPENVGTVAGQLQTLTSSPHTARRWNAKLWQWLRFRPGVDEASLRRSALHIQRAWRELMQHRRVMVAKRQLLAAQKSPLREVRVSPQVVARAPDQEKSNTASLDEDLWDEAIFSQYPSVDTMLLFSQKGFGVSSRHQVDRTIAKHLKKLERRYQLRMQGFASWRPPCALGEGGRHEIEDALRSALDDCRGEDDAMRLLTPVLGVLRLTVASSHLHQLNLDRASAVLSDLEASLRNHGGCEALSQRLEARATLLRSRAAWLGGGASEVAVWLVFPAKHLLAFARFAMARSGQELMRRQESLIEPVPNPFSNPAALTPYEIFKAGLVGVLLLPMRIGTVIACGVAEVLLIRLATLGTELKEDRGCWQHSAPFEVWRLWLLAPLKYLNRLALAAFGFWPGCIKVNDLRKEPGCPSKILVVAPHMTALDSLLIGVAFPPVPSGVGMTGLLQIPVMRSLAIGAQAIFVDRNNPESRRSCKEAIQARTVESWSGPPMMIFPQGVITNGSALTQFNVGAFSPGKAVVPVCLRYPWRHYNPAGCGQNHALGIALLRTMLQFTNECQIDILETYVPSPAEVANDRLFANNVRSVMAAYLNLPCTEQNYEDAFLAFGSRAHIGSDFEAARLRRCYNCSVDDLKAVLRSFECHDASDSGTISYEEFCSALSGLGGAGRLSQEAAIFAYFDQDRSGAVEYRDYIQVAALLSGRGSEPSRMQLAFLIADMEGSGSAAASFLSKLASEPVPQARSGDESVSVFKSGESAAVLDLNFAAFRDFALTRPGVVDASLEMLRRHLQIPLFGESGADKNEKCASYTYEPVRVDKLCLSIDLRSRAPVVVNLSGHRQRIENMFWAAVKGRRNTSAALALAKLKDAAYATCCKQSFRALRAKRFDDALRCFRLSSTSSGISGSTVSPMLQMAARNAARVQIAEGLLLIRSPVPLRAAEGVEEPRVYAYTAHWVGLRPKPSNGDVVFAPWAEDGFDYEATIESIDEVNQCCTVCWADGGQTCREVRLPALTSPLGSPCGRALRQCPQEVRLWASRRALRAALAAWQAQAEAGSAHDAFVDLAGLVFSAMLQPQNADWLWKCRSGLQLVLRLEQGGSPAIGSGQSGAADGYKEDVLVHVEASIVKVLWAKAVGQAIPGFGAQHKQPFRVLGVLCFGQLGAEESVSRLSAEIDKSRSAANLLLEVAALTFAMGCRLGKPDKAKAIALPLAVAAVNTFTALGPQPDDAASSARHMVEILISQELPPHEEPQRVLSWETLELKPSRARWRLVGYRARDEVWLLRRGRGKKGAKRLAALPGPPPLTWCLEGIALAETLPDLATKGHRIAALSLCRAGRPSRALGDLQALGKLLANTSGSLAVLLQEDIKVLQLEIEVAVDVDLRCADRGSVPSATLQSFVRRADALLKAATQPLCASRLLALSARLVLLAEIPWYAASGARAEALEDASQRLAEAATQEPHRVLAAQAVCAVLKGDIRGAQAAADIWAKVRDSPVAHRLVSELRQVVLFPQALSQVMVICLAQGVCTPSDR